MELYFNTKEEKLRFTTRMVETTVGAYELALPALQYCAAVHTILPVVQFPILFLAIVLRWHR